MAWIKISVLAPKDLDNPESIKNLDGKLTKAGLLVCFYLPPPKFMPLKQFDGTWPLRILKVDLDRLEWLKMTLLDYGFSIVREEHIIDSKYKR